MSLYEFLRQKRMNKALTQREAAELIGKSNHQFISNIERGSAKPSIAVLKQLCEIYDVEYSDMLNAYIDGEKEQAVLIAIYKWTALQKDEDDEAKTQSGRDPWVTSF
ncbi:helix-turn-helix domain-containing protein [Bdellovibrio sp. NC01]|uniref:helix-turn-helix domain-containing protein n=1 Tax=Bdellovibrio sp. NC01 TaxID=2220073 RepID=UPI00143D6DA3|nr:helix-turn-helix transcriptional regulator [Bdellovibrio sp. NC01]